MCVTVQLLRIVRVCVIVVFKQSSFCAQICVLVSVVHWLRATQSSTFWFNVSGCDWTIVSLGGGDTGVSETHARAKWRKINSRVPSAKLTHTHEWRIVELKTHNQLTLNMSGKQKQVDAAGATASVTTTAAQKNVMYTLLLFSTGMITLPLVAYYISLELFHGSTTMSAVSAIIVVQFILGAFIYKALNETEAKPKKD